MANSSLTVSRICEMIVDSALLPGEKVRQGGAGPARRRLGRTDAPSAAQGEAIQVDALLDLDSIRKLEGRSTRLGSTFEESTFGGRPRARPSWPASERNDASDVLACVYVLVALVDLVEAIDARDELVEWQPTASVKGEDAVQVNADPRLGLSPAGARTPER
jgi:hypothetical protein